MQRKKNSTHFRIKCVKHDLFSDCGFYLIFWLAQSSTSPTCFDVDTYMRVYLLNFYYYHFVVPLLFLWRHNTIFAYFSFLLFFQSYRVFFIFTFSPNFEFFHPFVVDCYSVWRVFQKKPQRINPRFIHWETAKKGKYGQLPTRRPKHTKNHHKNRKK